MRWKLVQAHLDLPSLHESNLKNSLKTWLELMDLNFVCIDDNCVHLHIPGIDRPFLGVDQESAILNAIAALTGDDDTSIRAVLSQFLVNEYENALVNVPKIIEIMPDWTTPDPLRALKMLFDDVLQLPLVWKDCLVEKQWEVFLTLPGPGIPQFTGDGQSLHRAKFAAAREALKYLGDKENKGVLGMYATKSFAMDFATLSESKPHASVDQYNVVNFLFPVYWENVDTSQNQLSNVLVQKGFTKERAFENEKIE
jgi:hypothetical protein